MLNVKVERIERESIPLWIKRVGIRSALRHGLKAAWRDTLGTLTGAIVGNVAFDGIDSSERTTTIFGTLTPAGNYPAAGGGGDIFSFAALDFIKSGYPPLRVYIVEQPAAGATPSGFGYVFCPGTTLANGKMVLLVGGGVNAPSVEKTGNPTYASLALSPLVFEAVFARV